MGNGSADNLVRLYSELVVLLTQEENLRNETEAKLAKAKLIIDPRNEFNKWLQTNTGKSWKQKKSQFPAKDHD